MFRATLRSTNCAMQCRARSSTTRQGIPRHLHPAAATALSAARCQAAARCDLRRADATATAQRAGPHPPNQPERWLADVWSTWHSAGRRSAAGR